MRVVLSQQDVVVPSLLQQRLQEARKITNGRAVERRVEGKRHHSTIPADRIVSQEPPPGSTLKTQRSVKVWTSLGPRRIQMPAVEGETLRSARLRLDEANIVVERVVE